MSENPAAFPAAGTGDYGDGIVLLQGGMSLRDYFAAHCDVDAYGAHNSYRRANGREPTIAELANYIAAIRYIEADAMLAKRSVAE
jgi:hypothetical protein